MTQEQKQEEEIKILKIKCARCGHTETVEAQERRVFYMLNDKAYALEAFGALEGIYPRGLDNKFTFRADSGEDAHGMPYYCIKCFESYHRWHHSSD